MRGGGALERNSSTIPNDPIAIAAARARFHRMYVCVDQCMCTCEGRECSGAAIERVTTTAARVRSARPDNCTVATSDSLPT